MQILFQNDQKVNIDLLETPLADVYKKIYRHLQHVDIPFRKWDNPYYDRQNAVSSLVRFASLCGVKADQSLCHDQDYLNHLHKIYEKNYNGDPKWLDFHEHIHICEWPDKSISKVLRINYREKAGLLERDFQQSWMQHSSTKVKPGDVYVRWAELGKSPYHYWKNKEPDCLDRLNELAKPWKKLRPTINVALESHDFLQGLDHDGFNQWWDSRQQQWCNHWNLDSWTLDDMMSTVVFGQIHNIAKISDLLQKQVCPVRVLL